MDEGSRQWLFDSFGWAITHFDADFFANDSKLVLPTNEFFPTRAHSADELANSVFDGVKAYTGLTQWPFQLVAPERYQPQHFQVKNHPLILRGQTQDTSQYSNMLTNPADRLSVSYDPVQMNQPQVMVANYASMLSSYLVGLSNQLPPGGEEYRAPGIEVLSIFMGFGVMFANTAYAFRGGCSSCHNHAANRVAVLTENESVFALALFCQLKDIDTKTVAPQLKKYLRPLYKQAVKEIHSLPDELERLQLLLPGSLTIEQKTA
jgi:hypothetical protein